MLTKLKREITVKEGFRKRQNKTELKIHSTMDENAISDLITSKLMEKIKTKFC